jgi:peroxiredoxin|tara:strand:+ start:2509 stop:3132 length:624 start_codon:yes stop_codon:yes gene_type:complete
MSELTIPVGMKLPDNVTFHMRVRDEKMVANAENNPYVWQMVDCPDIFKNKRVVLFAVPGAFTPTCSAYQLPDYDANYEMFKRAGIDEVYCLSVNDSFVQNKWSDWLDVDNVKFIPDGSGFFTEQMGALVRKDNLGFGARSWRYSLLANDGVVEVAFVEEGFDDNIAFDPYEVSDPATMMEYIQNESPIGKQLELNIFDGLGTDETFA